MKTSDYILWAGGVLLIIGTILVALAGWQGESFIILFPFFIVGDLGPTVAVFVVISLLLPLMLFVLFLRNVSHVTGSSVPGWREKICPSCGAGLPQQAEYCYRCGRPLAENQDMR